MSNGLVGHGELGKIVSDHVGLDFDGVPVLSTVAVNNGSAHLGHDDAVSQMSSDSLGLLTWNGGLLGGSELLDKSLVLSAHSVTKSSSLSGTHHLDDVVQIHVEEIIEFDSSVNLLSERLLLDNLR